MALGPIQNASDVPLTGNPGTLPDMSGTLMDWFQSMTFTLITKQIVNFQVVETLIPVTFYGVRQPFTPEQLQIKPSGERSLKWETIHALPTVQLTTDDRIIFDETTYRVMKKSNFKEYGYILYEICEDYVQT